MTLNLYEVRIKTNDDGLILSFLVPARDIVEARSKGYELGAKWNSDFYFLRELYNEEIRTKYFSTIHPFVIMR